MSESRAEKLAELFKGAAESGEANWSGYLDQSVDAGMRAELEELLREHRRGDSFWETPALSRAAESFVAQDSRIGERLGQYEVLELIGSGGMGDVYLARDSNLARKVALKVIRRGMDSVDIIRRFQHEELLLAGLNHPNIAQLYGGGVTDDGVPYFAMEYVAGQRIDRYCAGRSLRERLELFCKVCAAVSYAHQHLVVHRDLKPSNVLVTPEGEPKLLDFGIGKLLDASQAAAFRTVTIAPILTPEYASPEHVRGEAITTASDVYSLGVLLYELLTGTKPYRIDTRTPAEIERVITAHEPTRPSNQQSAIRNRKYLRGDLDNIVLMALRKEPQRRYASVGQFAADIRRYLDGLPVIAHKDTFSYRTSKFVRRHRMGVVAAALVLVSLVGGILSTMRQAHRAERRFNDVRSLADSLLFEIIPKFYTVPGTAEAQEIATRRALQYLDTLSQEGGNDLKLKRELAIAYRAVADHMDDSMTNYPRLVETRQKIIDFEEKLAKSEPSDLHAQDELARDYERFAWTLWRNGDDAKGLEFYNKALAVRKALLTADNESFDFNYRLGHVEMSIGDLFSNGNKPREALQHYRTALSSLEKLRQHKDEPANRLRLQRALAYAHNGMAAALSRANDLEAASAEYARGWALIEPMMSNLTNDLVACELVTRNYLGQAKVDSKRADYQNARTKLRHAIEILETLPQSETQTRVTLADAYTDLGAVLYQSGDAAHAAEYLQKAIHIQEELSQSAGSRQLQNALATSYDLLAAARRKLTER